MTRIVADASIVGNVMLPDELGDLSAALAERLTSSELIQPAHWPIETCGLILKAARRNRLPADERDDALAATLGLIASSQIESISRTPAVVELALRYHLTIYDAAYLELALFADIPLLTSDTALRVAAERAGAQLVPLP